MLPFSLQPRPSWPNNLMPASLQNSVKNWCQIPSYFSIHSFFRNVIHTIKFTPKQFSNLKFIQKAVQLLILKHFYHSKTKHPNNYMIISSDFPFPRRLSPWQSIIPSVSINFPILNISYKWFTHFFHLMSRFNHMVACGSTSSFLIIE